jgi:hypothetical protein
LHKENATNIGQLHKENTAYYWVVHVMTQKKTDLSRVVHSRYRVTKQELTFAEEISICVSLL